MVPCKLQRWALATISHTQLPTGIDYCFRYAFGIDILDPESNKSEDHSDIHLLS